MNSDGTLPRDDPQHDTSPGVSIVVPILNEARYLEASVRRLLEQRYDGQLEVVLALGPSHDNTRDVARMLADADSRVLLVDNPSGRTPVGLNLAIAASQFSYVVRCDGHAEVPSDYVAVAIETLQRTGADNVGGIMAAEGVTPFEMAVARAMTTPLGVGGASFHVGGLEGPAPTVYLGAFTRSALDRVGGYDESMVRAQDWEMNLRIRESGGLIWFTPKMRVTYRPRGSIRA
jgi:glycosyltransferase involved in cell wall biosynthesis